MEIPNAISLHGECITDFIECFIIPDYLAVVQFHIHPSENSSITVPIGFITTESNRLEQIYELLNSRISSASDIKIAWGSKTLKEILPESLLHDFADNSTKTNKPPYQPKKEMNAIRKRKFSFDKPISK